MRTAVLATGLLVVATLAGTAAAAPTIDVIDQDTEAGPGGEIDFVITVDNASSVDGTATAYADGETIWTSTLGTDREPRHVRVDGRGYELAPGDHTLRVNVSLSDGTSYEESWTVTVRNETTDSDAPAASGGAPMAQPESGPDLPDAVPDGVQSLVDGVFSIGESFAGGIGDLVADLASAIGGGGA